MKGSIEISFRTKTGGTLLYVQNQRKYFQIAVFKNQVTLSWNLTSDLPEIKRFAQENLSYDWQTLIINVQDNLLKANFKGYEEAYDTGVQQIATAEINQQEFINLFSGIYSYYLVLILENIFIPLNITNTITCSKSSFRGKFYLSRWTGASNCRFQIDW